MSKWTRVVCLISLFLSVAGFAAAPGGTTSSSKPETLSLERRLRKEFPSLVLDARATLEPAQDMGAGRAVSGMRPRPEGSAGGFRVFYPDSYDEPFVVELGDQRVALRAVGAHFSQGTASAGKMVYASPHASVDVIEVPTTGRSEELLLLRDAGAPRVFEYEILEMRGVAGLRIHEGAIHFAHLSSAPPTPSTLSGRFTAQPRSLQIDRPWVIDATGRKSERAARWTIVEPDDRPRRIRLTIDADMLVHPLVVDPSFSARGSMASTRRLHTATLLPNGKVLFAGGENLSFLSTAELYDPGTGTFTATAGPMTAARSGHTATLLPNGKVLIAGGQNGSHLNTAELFDPLTATFTATTVNMTAARATHTATLLPNGKVLITGGENASYLSTAELYDPATGTFTATAAPMAATRAYHTATMLPNGKVLIAGGANGVALSTAELYDPASSTFVATAGAMNTARYRHSATLLASGKVLMVAGHDGSSALFTAELYDPATGTFAAVPANMTSSRHDHSATLLPDGKVLLAGGFGLNTAEIYDPGAGTFTATSGMTSARFSHTGTLLPSGSVLIAGGYDGASFLDTAELYQSASGTFNATGTPMATARTGSRASLLPNGKVLIAGGLSGTGISSNTAQLYDPATDTFTATGTPMAITRRLFTVTLLPDGQVLVCGGNGSDGYTRTAELFNSADGTFTATNGLMTTGRGSHTATLLPNGNVLITGGRNLGPPFLATAELYLPATGMFVATGSMITSRYLHTATLLPNGKVLIVGGISEGGPVGIAELYDPASGTFTATNAPPSSGRSSHTATLLPNGEVLIAGGSNGPILDTAELYDPVSGTFSATNWTMAAPRVEHSATLLPSGDVLVAGGNNGGGAYHQTAELYDPTTGTFAPTAGSMSSARASHVAILLPGGSVLLGSGTNSITSFLNTAESYDPGLGFSNGRRPVVSSLAGLLCQPASLSLSGSLFTGDSEGSGGSTNNSAANGPLLRLRRVDNDHTQFALSQSSSASSFFSRSLSSLGSGRYRAAIVSHAIPSNERIIDVETTPVLATYASASIPLSGTATMSPSSLPAGFNGAFYPQTAQSSGAFSGNLAVHQTSGDVTVTDAGPVGDFTITISSSTGCGSPTTTFAMKVIGPPSSVTATGGTPQSARVNTAFASVSATVTDSAGHPLGNVAVNFTAPASGASATFPSDGSAVTNASGVATIVPTANGTLGSYDVHAVVGALTASFALTNTPAIPTHVAATATSPTSVLVTWTGTSGATYEVVRFAAGGITSTIGTSVSGSLTDNSASANTAYLYKVRATAPDVSPYGAPDLATTVIFTDPTLLTSTRIKSVHVTQLRTAVDAVRTLAGLSAGSYVDPTITSGAAIIKAAHVNNLRTALDAARSSGTLSLPANVYTTPSPVAFTTTVSAADITDLRKGVQ